VDTEAGLIRLLDPPLAQAQPSAGYIQAYPPGVRENGGQYAHAGVWALMAQAELAATQPGANAGGDLVYRYFTYLSPAHRAAHPDHGPAYGLEPYVMAGDVYSQPPHVGRGGWSWYTGSASWLHRAVVESMFGLKQGPEDLRFSPCLPTHWPRAELTLKRGERSMRFILIRPDTLDGLRHSEPEWVSGGERILQVGQALRWLDLPTPATVVIPMPA
jgi:cyclic beta-1,2-glucan synthetase